MADPADVAHLLRRTEFVVRPQRLAELSALSLEAAVDDVLDIARNGDPQLPSSLSVDAENSWEQYVAAVGWWLDAMLTRPRPVQEKLTLFWHGHFTSSWWDVHRGYHMCLQNQLYRRLALGNFVQLTQEMALQPAMLVYLSNGENVKGKPNQNFARELLELFTLGAGNYAESDVEAAARAWTGFNYDWEGEQYVFRALKHDPGDKTFFGVTRAWTGPQLVEEMLRTNPTTRLSAARFIARKLWEFFAHPVPPAGVVDALAAVFVANDMELEPLLRALLTRPEFYAPAAKQGLVRTPTEFLVALSYHTGIPAGALGAAWRGDSMGQQLFQPPNVSGWRHNAYWLNTSALGGRADLARGVTWHLRNDARFDFLYGLGVEEAVDHVAGYFGLHPLSPTTRDALVAAHRAERAATKWNNWWAPTNLLTMAMLSPEMHMA